MALLTHVAKRNTASVQSDPCSGNTHKIIQHVSGVCSNTRVLTSVATLLLLILVSQECAWASPMGHVHLRRRDSMRKLAIRSNMSLPVFQYSSASGSAGDDRMPLHDYMNAEYFAPLNVGTPHQTFEMIYDTGSSDVWIPQVGCSPCGNHTTYNSGNSSTYRPDGSAFSIRYGSGAVSGTNVYDSVNFGNVIVSNYSFAQAIDLSGMPHYDQAPFDGIVGLAFPALASPPHVPLFHEAIAQHQVEKGVFCFYLGRSNGKDGEMDFGGIDTEKYIGQIHYVPVIQDQWWVIGMQSMTVGGQRISNAKTAIVDSGTTMLVGSVEDVTALANALGAQTYDMQGAVLVLFPCAKLDTLQDINIVLNDKLHTIPGSALSMGEAVSGYCILSIEGMPGFNQGWIFGDIFMRQYYTIFDVTNNRVGFAKAV